MMHLMSLIKLDRYLSRSLQISISQLILDTIFILGDREELSYSCVVMYPSDLFYLIGDGQNVFGAAAHYMYWLVVNERNPEATRRRSDT